MPTLPETRRFYAEEIAAVAHLGTEALVEALATVPRERFLGEGPWDIGHHDFRKPGAMAYSRTPDADPRRIYHNVPVAIDVARGLNNGQPSALAASLDSLKLRAGQRFLHVGCGTGYYTALAAAVVGAAGRVFALDVDPSLAGRARDALADLDHVRVESGDGASIDPWPCDAILVNAGFTHPAAVWLDSLNPGGRLLLPVTAGLPGSPISSGGMLLVRRTAEGWDAAFEIPIAIFASPVGRDPSLDDRIRKAFATGAWLRVRRLRREAHEPGEACVVHADGVCLSA